MVGLPRCPPSLAVMMNGLATQAKEVGELLL